MNIASVVSKADEFRLGDSARRLVTDKKQQVIDPNRVKQLVRMLGGSLDDAQKSFLDDLARAYQSKSQITAMAGRRVTAAGESLRDMNFIGWRASKGSPHFVKHGQHMGYTNLRLYTEGAKEFAKKSGNVIESKVGNLIFKYDHDTQRILIASQKERTIVTFYNAKDGLASFKEAMVEHLKVITKQNGGSKP